MTDIKIIRTSLSDVAAILKEYSEIFIVYDKKVSWVVERLGINARASLAIDAAEDNKCMDTVMAIDRWLMENGANRDALVLGVGGGITTDIVGFAASIYKRGVRFAFLPTTLLAQVDAAIGGKNGVNLDSFKNMIGVIRQPEVTIICAETLESLPYGQIVSGAAELLKTFIISNKEHSYEVSVKILSEVSASEDKAAAMQQCHTQFQNVVAAAAAVKAGVAGRDPEEHGERRFLNLGHTFAHAIEKLSDEKIGHGAAVSMGIVLAARLSESLGLAEKGFAGKIESDFRKSGLPTECPFRTEDFADAMKKDKKAEGQIVHFVLPIAIGEVRTMDLTVEDALSRLV